MSVALYARVSTKDQDTDNQMMKLDAYAAARGHSVYGRYTDKVSGTRKHRPSLDRMIDDAKSGKFDRIVATKIDRLGRSIINIHEFFTQMKEFGISIDFTDQPIDTSSALGRFMINILGAVAEFERELISERTIDGLRRAVANGKKLGRKFQKMFPHEIGLAKSILKENPEISNRQLAGNFSRLSRNTSLRILKEEGVIA
jgi:DNA invertase Pin-like site-specific DNA recombinase